MIRCAKGCDFGHVKENMIDLVWTTDIAIISLYHHFWCIAFVYNCQLLHKINKAVMPSIRKRLNSFTISCLLCP
jgi:hypothetical protein